MKGNMLQATREKSGKTQAQVAKAVGMDWRTYQKWEYGNGASTVRTAIRIADALGVRDLRQIWGA